MSSGLSFLNAIRSRLGLEAKFVLLASLALVVGSSVANRLVLSYQSDGHLRTAEEKGKLLVESMAISFTHTLLYEEVGLVEESGLMDSFIRDILKTREMDVLSVMVFDPQGRVMAHDDYREYGKAYGDEHTRRALAGWETSIQRYARGGSGILDIATPLRIASKRWGTLRLIVSLGRVEAEIRAFALRLALLTVASVVAGIVMALTVARALARPIKRLAAAMEEVGADLQTDFEVGRPDEIGHLQRTFLDMLDRLRKAVQRQMRMRQMLIQRERLASIGTLTAGVAHEINNPLSGLRNCLRRIQRHPENAVQIRHYSDLMLEAVERIGKIVKGMLDFARQEDLTVQPLRVPEILQETIGLAEHRLREHRIELKTGFGTGLPEIRGDRHRIGQAFLNLILNAIDAMPDGGALHISCAQSEKYLVTRVRDTGCGIPEAQIGRIFDPFYTTKEVGEGTGLGLSITYGIVEEHSGRIAVESREGEGTEFVVYLPMPDGLEGTGEDGKPENRTKEQR